MIEPIKMKPQNSTNFKGINANHDPLNARNSYASVLKDNEGVLYQEALKMQRHDPSKNGALIDLKG